MKDRISDLVKRYFLKVAAATGGPFLAGAMVGMVPAVLAIFVLIPIFSHQTGRIIDIALGLMVFGAGLGALNYSVCTLFVSHDRGVLYFLQDKEGEFVFDEEGKPIAANPLLRPWGMKAIRIWLPTTNRPHEIDPAPIGGWGGSVKLRVIFERSKNTFDAQEVYKEIVGANCHGFEELVLEEFRKAVRLAGLKGLFGQLYERPLKDVKEELYNKLKTHFRVAGLFSNVKCVKVVLAPKMGVDFY